MNKKIIILIISISLIVSLTMYFIADKKLYYFGKNRFDIYESLPLEVKPIFQPSFEGGFALEDKNGFFLVSNGIYQYRFSQTELSVKQVLGYGYKHEQLIVLIKDSSEKKYVIEFFKNPDISQNPYILAKVFYSNGVINSNEYKWIDVKNGNYADTEILRNRLGVICLVLLAILIYFAIKSFRLVQVS